MFLDTYSCRRDSKASWLQGALVEFICWASRAEILCIWKLDFTLTEHQETLLDGGELVTYYFRELNLFLNRTYFQYPDPDASERFWPYNLLFFISQSHPNWFSTYISAFYSPIFQTTFLSFSQKYRLKKSLHEFFKYYEEVPLISPLTISSLLGKSLKLPKPKRTT